MNNKKDYLSIPEVARRMNVHRNTVLSWVRAGYVRSVFKNAFVSRPQYLISLDEVKRIEKERYVKA